MKLKTQFVAAALMLAAVAARAASVSAFNLDADANRVLKTFDVPGMAIAIVKDGKVVTAKGYGVRQVGTEAAVNGLATAHRHDRCDHRDARAAGVA